MTTFSEKESLSEVCSRYIGYGKRLAIGGQNLNRNPIATALTFARLNPENISLLGCNLSLAADIISYSGGVSQIQCGSINLEIGGLPPNLKYLCENDIVEVIDFDHKTMLSRLVAAQLGIDFIPADALAGSSIAEEGLNKHKEIFSEVRHPWQKNRKVLVVRSLRPDVCLLHVHCIDQFGNLYISGVVSADDDLAKSSQIVVATCEEFLDKEIALRRYGSPFLSGAFVDHAVQWPNGGWPCGMPDLYDVDYNFLSEYIDASKLQRDRIVADLIRATT
jgi:glutaconate CoA-transferase subunit A